MSQFGIFGIGWHAHVFVGMFGQAKAHDHAYEDVGMPPAYPPTQADTPASTAHSTWSVSRR
jgi:hypothetical protein